MTGSDSSPANREASPTMSETTPPRQSERVTELLSVLADGERRTIIIHLRDKTTGTASLETLTTVLVPESPAHRDRARIRLHHTHLPKLATTPLLSYDPATTHVEYHGHPELDSLLETIHHSETAHPNAAP